MSHVDNPFESPAVISFCPGILGIERGLARADVHCRVVAFIEIEAFIISQLVTRMEKGLLAPAPIWTDAKTFDARPLRGRVHGIIGGYPCPGESLAGMREGHLYKGFIWPAIRRAIAAARPLWCFFENVDDHLTGTFPIVLRSLRNMGYRVEAGVYTAGEVGAPQERKRLFILAVDDALCFGPQSKYKIPAGRYGVEPTGKEGLGDAESINKRDEGIGEKIGGRKIKAGRSGDEKLANTGSEGLQGVQPGQLYGRRERAARSIAKCRPEDFPLGQGIEQWDWEEERTVESSMVYSTNGYSFIGDIHRAVGNSVVEQTAEIAFTDLLQKHLKNQK